MPGIPVVIAANGRGIPVKSVTGNAPVMTVATNGLGIPIVLSDRGAPFVVEGGVVPTLNPLTVTPNTATVGAVYNGSVSGRTAGSTLALTGAGAAGLSINSETGAITGTPSSAGAVNVVETLSGAIGSPRTSNGVVAVSSADEVVSRNAVRTLPPSALTTGGSVAGTGSIYTYTSDLVNLSGANMATANVVCMGWFLNSNGTVACGNDVPLTGFIEYPIGGTQTAFSFTAVDNTTTLSGDIDLGTGIPSGATFRISLSSNVATNQKRILQNGFAGVNNKALRSTMVKEVLGAMGDSIQNGDGTNIVYAAANGKCPVAQMAIAGTKAVTYAVPAVWAKIVDLFVKLGTTRVITNYSINDFGGFRSLEEVIADLTYMRDQTRLAGMKFTQITQTPKSTRLEYSIAAGDMVSSGITMTVAVPDSSKFIVSDWVTVSGATQSEYNGNWPVVGIPDATHVQIGFGGASVSPATGSIILGPLAWGSIGLQADAAPNGGVYYQAPGPDSPRGKLNSFIRSSFDDYIDWGDVLEPFRDAGRWAANGQTPFSIPNQVVQVTSAPALNRFDASFSGGANAFQAGLAYIATGVNAGLSRSSTGSTATQITLNSNLPNLLGVGDTVYMRSSSSSFTLDGLHPGTSPASKGGKNAIIAATVSKIDQWLAA